MKIIKKITSLILSFAIMTSCSVVAFAENLSVNDKIDRLIEKGFPESFLKNKDASQIEEIYDFFSASDSVCVKESTAGLSENLSPSKPYPLGDIPRDQMTLRINTILDLDKNNNNQIKRVVVNIDYEWVMGRPLICFDDAIAVNWDSSVFGFSGNFVAHDSKKTVLSPNEWITTKTTNYPSEAKQGGIGYFTTLSYPGVDTPIQHRGNSMFELIPRKSPIYYSGSGSNYTIINVEYAHNIVGALSFSAQGVGISINGASLNDRTSRTEQLYYKN